MHAHASQSMEGLSARSVVINAFCQLVILLYLLDNETSLVVLFSAFTVSSSVCVWGGGGVMTCTVNARVA
jgi:hypothetical protein